MSVIKDLSNIIGISPHYKDKMGQIHTMTDKLRKIFLSSIEYNCQTENLKKILDEKLYQKYSDGIDKVNSFFLSEKKYINIYIPVELKNEYIYISLKDSNNEIFSEKHKIKICDIEKEIKVKKQKFIQAKILITTPLASDYYHTTIKIGYLTLSTLLIISPNYSYEPKAIRKKEKLLGIGIQLYALRSKNDMGIGDFSSLKKFIKLAYNNGCDLIGINPVCAMSSKSKDDVSPYRCLSREYINYIYLDLYKIDEFKKSPVIRQYIQSSEFKTTLHKLREKALVDYTSVFKLKIFLLKKMYKFFIENDLKNDTLRYKKFLKFKKQEGQNLYNLCIFESISEIYGDYIKRWPKPLQKFDSKNLQTFINKHKTSIDFYAYIHWLSSIQLLSVKKLTEKLNMKIGLYVDIPVGASSSGAEVWQSPNRFATNIDIGTPPDTIRPKGQKWGLTPPNPEYLISSQYKDFISLLQQNMKYAGAIRLDHAFSLMRLFWVTNKNQGGYVNYNIKDMTAILCLESHKNKCLVIGEDLGNAPDGFFEYMSKHKIFSNKVLLRQKDDDGKFINIKNFSYYSLCQISTHDQATSYGFWLSEDIKANLKCQLYPKLSFYKSSLIQRKIEKQDLFDALSKTNSFYNNKQSIKESLSNETIIPHDLEYSFNIYGSKSNSAIFLVRIEDIFKQKEMENVPGTVNEYPNWRIKIPYSIESTKTQNAISVFFDELKKHRK